MIILHLILHSAVHIYDFHISQNFNPASAGRFLREEYKPEPHDEQHPATTIGQFLVAPASVL